MRVFSLTVVYTLAFIGAASLLQELEITGEVINAIIQVPMVGGLIYLVLKLEDKRQASALIREESFRSIVDSLLGVIVELSSIARPGTIGSEDLNNLKDYIKQEVSRSNR